MAPRVDLQVLLEAALGTAYVYFQPPTNVVMTYPCLVYKRDAADTKFADNKPYGHRKRYQVTLIDKNPDSGVYDKLAALPMCRFDRHYTADNLNHDVFTIFF